MLQRKSTLGENLSFILTDIEKTILLHNVRKGSKPGYTMEGLRAAVQIFMSALMDKMYDLQEAENMPFTDRENMARNAGESLRKLMITYTGLDPHDMYR